MEYNWSTAGGYVVSKIDGKNVSIHRFVMNVIDPKIFVDHKFHDKLDNRKSQLRVCTYAQNIRNSKPRGGSSQYKGVSWHKNNKNWVAEIMSDGVKYRLGSFNKEEDAACAYDAKATELFGEFANLNFK